MKKTVVLKDMLQSPTLEFLMEAHNGLSAKMVEETGFKGIWASGLAISASLGLRDNNEASWTQVLEVLEFMSDVTSIPILLDGDTGYGDFNNMRRLVKKLEQRGIAGVCIEDKVFPKSNSFIDGELQQLADIEEFCGKIKAGKDSQKDGDFCIIARTEAFIAGWGVDEAIKRAEAYYRAGADAILVHSKKADPSDIELFMQKWEKRHPVIIAPTSYYSTPTARFAELGVSVVIWANHTIRAAAKAMQEVIGQIHKEQSLINIEDRVITLSELFRLQGAEELRMAESRYLPNTKKSAKAIILAASRGAELGDLTKKKPKAMIEINGRPILTQMVNILNELGVKDITVVRGYKKECIADANISKIDNNEYESTADLWSLFLAREKLNGDSIIIYGDLLVRRHLISDLFTFKEDLIIVVDADVPSQNDGYNHDYVICNRRYSNDFFNSNVVLKKIETSKSASDKYGEWTGILYASPAGAEMLRETMESLSSSPNFKSLTIIDLLGAVIKKHPVSVLYTKGGWVNINRAYDIEKAGRFYD